MAQETQTGVLDQPKGVGWGGTGEGISDEIGRVQGGLAGDGREVQKGGDVCIPMADYVEV